MQLEFFFDFISPWAYLASTRVEPLAADCGTTVRWIPVELERVKTLTERETVPYTPVFMQYVTRDVMRWAERYGVRVSMPVVVPTTPLLHGFFFAEAAGTVPAYVHRVFQSRWGRGKDLSDETVLRSIATDCGLNVQAFISATTAEPNAVKLEANCRAAAERGVFGVPTCAVGDEIFWGNDRLDFVAEALAAR